MSHDRRRKIALLGAFDRFNYGDLLFPLVVSNEMEFHSPDAEIATHSLIAGDYSRFGAIKSQSYRALLRHGALHENDIVVFAGGGTIGAKWSDMHRNLLGSTGNAALYYLNRIFGAELSNLFSQRYFGSNSPFPWIATPQDFPVPVQVAYNAVGGSEFSHLAPAMQETILERLRKATYLSVRDTETKRVLAAVENTVEINLAPDSAVLMSEQFPIQYLESTPSEALTKMLLAGPYVCFQANVRYTNRNADRIVSMLGNLYEKHGLRAVLLPIGRYVGLDDQIALTNILKGMRTPAQIISDDASIWEIMLVIAKANLFVGTSLHGNITAQSFTVPHLGLRDLAPNKLDHYLATWALPGEAHCVGLDEVPHVAIRALSTPLVARQQKRSELIQLSHDNFKKMAYACGLDWRETELPPAVY